MKSDSQVYLLSFGFLAVSMTATLLLLRKIENQNKSGKKVRTQIQNKISLRKQNSDIHLREAIQKSDNKINSKDKFENKNSQKHVIVLGGGGGVSDVLRSLKRLVFADYISSLYGLIATSDDGGSSGILRDNYLSSSWGSIGKNILSLANENTEKHKRFIKALYYRYDRGPLKGHTLRNLLMTTFELHSDVNIAVEILKEVLDIPDNMGVVPLTNQPTTLILESNINNMTIKGQYKIAQSNLQEIFLNNFFNYKMKIESFPSYSQKPLKMKYQAAKHLEKSTHIIIAPGHLHGSIFPALLTPNLDQLVKDKILIYIIPFFNRMDIKQTVGWKSSDYVEAYNFFLKRKPNYVIVNNNYEQNVQSHEWVEDDGPMKDINWISKDLASSEINQAHHADVVMRNPIRSNEEKLSLTILSIIF